MSNKPSRRSFLKTAVIATAAVGVTACGGTAIAAVALEPKIDQPSKEYGDKALSNKRILVTYATKAGSTADIAARMGEMLSARGLAVDVRPVGQVKDLSAYAAVVAGSAIRMGNPLPEMVNFVKTNQATLSAIPFSAFVVCLTIKDDTEENRKTVAAFLEPIRTLVKPASEAVFAGVLDPSRLGLLDKLIINMMKAPAGDYRQWDRIGAFAQAIAA